MSVIPFPRPGSACGSWQPSEIQSVVDACAEPLAIGEVSGWETGTTEAGDPQLYLLGPEPERECLVCLSRLGANYVLQDGQGRILFEHDTVGVLAEKVRSTLRHKTRAIVARAALAWVAFREAFEERVEPALAEPAEMISMVAPPLAALI